MMTLFNSHLLFYKKPCPYIISTALTTMTIIFNLSIGSTNRVFLYILFWPYLDALNSHMGQLPNEFHWQQRWVFNFTVCSWSKSYRKYFKQSQMLTKITPFHLDLYYFQHDNTYTLNMRLATSVLKAGDK